MIELDTTTLKPVYKFEYYMYGHFSKFVRTDAVRIESSSHDAPNTLQHVVFRNAASARGAGNAGATVAIVVNTGFEDHELQLQCGTQLSGVAKLVARSLATFRFHGKCDEPIENE